MKKIVVFLILALFLVAGQNEVKAQSEDCFEVPDNIIVCSDDTLKSITISNVNPNYALCNFDVSFYKKDCFLSPEDSCDLRHIVMIQIVSIEWEWDSSDCIGLTQALYPGYPNDFGTLDADEFRDFVENLQAAISREVFIDIYNNTPDSTKFVYHCEVENDECVMPDTCTHFSLFFTDPKCQAICEQRANGVMSYYFVPCIGEDAPCCRHTRYFCYCPVNETVLVYEKMESNPGDCGEYEQPYSTMCTEYGTASHPYNDYRVLRDCEALCE